MLILGPTAGETWLAYVGVPDCYPDFHELSRDIDDAMWEAAQDVLRDRKAADPVLRAMTDERCALWETVTCPAGALPSGTQFSVERRGGRDGRDARAWGRLRPLNRYELRRAVDFPYDADRVGVDWHGRDDAWTYDWPDLRESTPVNAIVPVPFDLSALLALIDAAAISARPVRRPRKAPRRKAAA